MENRRIWSFRLECE